MPAAIPAAVAGVGMIGQAIAGNSAANAAQNMATAQQAQAQANQKQALGFAAPTALELGNMNSQLQQANTSLQRQQQMFASIDPTLMESSKQALQLLQGQSAATVSPMLAQRQQQRQQLQQQLQQQLGSGGASSSAGAQALANFDLQTSNYQAQLQQSALGTLLGQTDVGAQSAQASGAQAGQLFGQVGQQAGAIQNRQVSASLTSGQQLLQSAGAPYVGSLAQSQNMGQLFGSIAGAAGGMAGASAFGGMGGGSSGASGASGLSTTTTGGYGLGAMRAPMAQA